MSIEFLAALWQGERGRGARESNGKISKQVKKQEKTRKSKEKQGKTRKNKEKLIKKNGPPKNY